MILSADHLITAHHLYPFLTSREGERCGGITKQNQNQNVINWMLPTNRSSLFFATQERIKETQLKSMEEPRKGEGRKKSNDSNPQKENKDGT